MDSRSHACCAVHVCDSSGTAKQMRVNWPLPHGQKCLQGAVVSVCLAACGPANMFLMKGPTNELYYESAARDFSAN